MEFENEIQRLTALIQNCEICPVLNLTIDELNEKLEAATTKCTTLEASHLQIHESDQQKEVLILQLRNDLETLRHRSDPAIECLLKTREQT